MAGRRRTLAPRDRRLLASAQDAELILLAADSAEALDRKLHDLQPVALRISRSDLTDLAFHLARQPMSGKVRAALVVSRPQELADRLIRLRNWLADGTENRLDVEAGVMLGSGTRAPGTPGRPAIGYLFSGQGTAFRRDGGLWGRRFATVRELYAFADLPRDGSDAATEIAQPAIIAASLAGLDILTQCGIEATVGIGHSLGELAAYHWAGAIDKPALLRLAYARGRAIAEHGRPGGAMASIGAGEETVAPAIAGRALVLAGLNAPLQTVISGDEAAVEEFVDLVKGAGIAATRLHVSHAFHSSYMDIAATVLRNALERERFQGLTAAVVSTVTGSKLAADADLRQLLFQQMTNPVRFAEAVGRVAKDVDLWIEVGPGHVLTGMMCRMDDSPVIALDAGGPSLKGLLKAFAAAFALGAPVSAEALFAGRFHRPFDPAHQPRFLANPCEQAPASEGKDEGGRMKDEPQRPDVDPSTFNLQPSTFNVSVLLRQSPGTLWTSSVAWPPNGRNCRWKPWARTCDLLGDLHLSSIAVAQLVVESARALGLDPPVWPTEAANATIAEVAEALEQLAGNAGAAVEVRQESLPGIEAWTRPFTVELVECPLRRRTGGFPVSGTGHPLAGRVPLEGGTRPASGCPVPDTLAWKIIAEEDNPLRALLPALLDREAPGGGAALCLPPAPGERHIDLLLEAAREVIGNADRKKFLLVEHGGGAAGFARTLHLEHPELTVCVVDVPVGHAAAAEWIAAEAAAARGYVEAHYDAPRDPPRAALAAPRRGGKLRARCRWGRTTCCWSPAAARGLAPSAALALAKASGARLALVGRSRPENDAELAANLRRFADHGVKFRYDAVDVTDAGAVRRTVQEIETGLGPVTGVLHSAGANVPQRLDTLDRAAFLRTLKPKVHGLAKRVGCRSRRPPPPAGRLRIDHRADRHAGRGRLCRGQRVADPPGRAAGRPNTLIAAACRSSGRCGRASAWASVWAASMPCAGRGFRPFRPMPVSRP